MSASKDTSISNLFKRISTSDLDKTAGSENVQFDKQRLMITKVTVRPNPFTTVITLDISCAQNRNIIVRMFNEEGKIVKMFSWYLVKGTNVTAINDLDNVSSGTYALDIIDNEGTLLFSYELKKG